MKKMLLLGFLVATNTAYAEVKMVPLDMQLGYWETNAEMLQSDALAKILENVPEAQREMMREMMGSKMTIPATQQCITKDSFKDMEKQMQESLGDQGADQNCKFEVLSSSSKEYSGKLICESMVTFVNTKVINSKRQETIVESTAEALGGTKLKLIAEWKAETCPEGL